MAKLLRIKNFDSYQHYKQRNPPWIKLHLSLLDDPDFLRLEDASKWHYVGLLLLASRHANAIKPDADYIKNRLGLTSKLNLTPRFLKDHVLASYASTRMLSINSEIGGSEKRRDREETEDTPLASPPAQVGRVGFPQDWKPEADEMEPWKKHGINPYIEFATFRDHALANDRRCKDWKAAFRNWCRKAITNKERGPSWPASSAGSIRVNANGN